MGEEISDEDGKRLSKIASECQQACKMLAGIRQNVTEMKNQQDTMIQQAERITELWRLEAELRHARENCRVGPLTIHYQEQSFFTPSYVHDGSGIPGRLVRGSYTHMRR